MDVQKIQCIDNLRTIDAISIPYQIPRGGIEGKCLDHLKACPLGSRVPCDVEVNDTSPVERQNQEYVKRPKCDGLDC